MKFRCTITLAFFTLGLLTFNSCQEATKKSEFALMDGIWESVGYGRIVKMDNGAYIMAEITAISCIPLEDGEIAEFGDALQLKNDTLTLQDGINTYYFTRISDAPILCKKDSPERIAAEAKANDPVYNFEVLWNTFNEHYAYFELRNINWDSSYHKYRPMVTQETTPRELYQVMNEMLGDFDDGHIGLDPPSEVEDAVYPATDVIPNENKRVRLRAHEVANRIATKYIPKGTGIKNNNLRWGRLEGNVGYIQFNQMMGMANLNLSDTLSFRDYWMTYMEQMDDYADNTTEELKGVKTSLDIVFKELENTDALIVDVRFNGGGKDEVGMAFLDRLNGEEKLVFTKKGSLGDGFTPTIKVTQGASQNPYNKAVYLLISTVSASATEIMVLSSLSLPNITRIGSNTEGVFSDVLDRVLPNGWEFGLSSEVYESMDGTNYEGIGIPADIDMGYSRNTQDFYYSLVDALDETGDVAIEKALELAKKNNYLTRSK